MKGNKRLVTAIEAVVLFLIVFFTSFFDVFYSLDCMLRDKFYQSPRGINNKIKIIAIDDETLRQLGPFGTWSRSVYADVINILGDHPSVIAMDIMFFGEMDEQGDNALRQACIDSSNVIAGSYIDYTSKYSFDENGDPYIDHFAVNAIDQPIIEDCCVTGFVNSSPDEDGVVRSAFVTENAPELYGDKVFNSFASEIYSMYCRKNGIEPNVPSLDANGRMWINYAGRPGDYEHISLCSVLDGSIDPRVFENCIVIVGAYASGLRDQFAVPNSSEQMYGAEIHANIVQGLIDGRYPVPGSRVLISLCSAAVAVVAYLLTKRIKFRISAPIVLVMLAGYCAAGIGLNNNGTTIPLFYAPIFMALAYLINLCRKYVQETIEKRKITSAFKKYVAPQVVEEIAKTGQYQIKLGGENRDIAVLFVDIRGFTPMSESLEPEQVVDILNSYLNLTTNSIFKNGGTLDKFIGDATMAVFNAPFDLDDYVFRAVKTAYDIVSGGNAIESKFLEKYGKSVSFGVGVNCGPAVVGNIGCDFRMDYTAIGDTVNTAARLEANAKRGQVLISEKVYEQVKDRVTVEPIGEIPLKGKSKGVFVYSLTGINAEDEQKAKELVNE
ncbi:MAG: CHASE2 domain-containing protein [Oscillospiraceae bacterium]